jgi:hypothetical protein
VLVGGDCTTGTRSAEASAPTMATMLKKSKLTGEGTRDSSEADTVAGGLDGEGPARNN